MKRLEHLESKFSFCKTLIQAVGELPELLQLHIAPEGKHDVGTFCEGNVAVFKFICMGERKLEAGVDGSGRVNVERDHGF